MNPKYNWLRWIAVLPAAILSYLIAYNLLRLLNLFNNLFDGRSNEGWYSLYIIPVIAAGAAGYCFVAWGSFVAPSHRKHTGIILLILIALLTGGALLVEISKTRAMGIIELVGSIVGAVIAYFSIEEPELA